MRFEPGSVLSIVPAQASFTVSLAPANADSELEATSAPIVAWAVVVLAYEVSGGVARSEIQPVVLFEGEAVPAGVLAEQLRAERREAVLTVEAA